MYKNFIPNEQQVETLEDMLKWWSSSSSDQVYELSGRPGTGKTTLIKYFLSKIGLQQREYVLCAFTGKATVQLIRNGNQAKTIHSAFYHRVDEVETDEHGIAKTKLGKLVTKKVFKRLPREEIISRGLKLIIIDEGGMVGKRIGEELLDIGVKVLVLGDIDQLPPVMDKRYFLINPNSHLTKIMRQSEGDSIITISHKIINGEKIDYGWYGNNVLVIPYESVNDLLLTSADIILASRNKTRDEINNHIRYDINKRKNADPYVGDKVICRQNDWDLYVNEEGNDISLVNGLSGIITNVYKETYLQHTMDIDFHPNFTKDSFIHLDINHDYYTGNYTEREKIKSGFKPLGHLLEPGDCITVHLSQGSEYPFVCYFLEDFSFNKRYMRQLHYTAVTRAQKKLVIVK